MLLGFIERYRSIGGIDGRRESTTADHHYAAAYSGAAELGLSCRAAVPAVRGKQSDHANGLPGGGAVYSEPGGGPTAGAGRGGANGAGGWHRSQYQPVS